MLYAVLSFGLVIVFGFLEGIAQAAFSPKSSRTEAVIRAFESLDITTLEREVAAGLPADLTLRDLKRAARVSVRRVKRWRRQCARRIARGLPPKPWPWHDKAFPAWDDPDLDIQTFAYGPGKWQRIT